MPSNEPIHSVITVKDDASPKFKGPHWGLTVPALLVSGLAHPSEIGILVAAIVGTVILSVIALVVVPAVWSTDESRRKAAADVLGKILGR